MRVITNHIEHAAALGYRVFMAFAGLQRLLTAVVMIGVPLFGACAGSSEATSTRREINGQVRDVQSSRGIAGASVEFVSDALEKTETSTDDDGRYSLAIDVSDDIVFGHVTASHGDYEPAAAMSVYFDGTQNVLDFVLRHKANATRK